MEISDSIEITKPINIVWPVIVDIENSANYISSILDIEILNKPTDNFIGFKWKETRMFAGKEASETMWITESKANQYYISRAESNGSIYTSRKCVEQNNGSTTLTMFFLAEPQTIVAKILTFVLKPMILKSLRSELARDLADIKDHIEKQTRQASVAT